MIVSADTLVYFGPLEEVVAAADGALASGGRLIFTVEELEGAEQTPATRSGASGRYRHAREYVEAVLTRRASAGDRVGRAPSRSRRTSCGAGGAGHEQATGGCV